MADVLRLAALAQRSIADAVRSYRTRGDLDAWAAAMRGVITRAQTAAWLAGAAERLGVSPNSPLLSERRLSRAERAEITRAAQAQLDYLAGFVRDMPRLSEAQAAARAAMYAGATRQTYYASRWGAWDIPSELMPGNQQCKSNCRCTISIADNGDGTGTLTRTMYAEHHCTECPALAGDHSVRRKAA